MLIVSKFHDYYDTASVYGVDKEYVYNRTEKMVKSSISKENDWKNHWPYEEVFVKKKANATTEYKVNKQVIGFCGKLHPVVVVNKKLISTGSKVDRFSFYDIDKALDFFEKEKVELKDKNFYWSMRSFSLESKKSMDIFFSGSEFKDLEKEFQRHKCPVFMYGRFQVEGATQYKERLVLNPRLKDYRFAQVKDPVTAFQEIYMFLAGVLGISDVPMPKFTDKQKAQAKGHDGKYSFRKPPKKKGK